MRKPSISARPHRTRNKGSSWSRLPLTVVLEAFGDIHHLDSGRLLELATVDDELVGDHAGPAREQNLVVALQPLLHVVSVQDGHLSRLTQTLVAHHLRR